MISALIILSLGLLLGVKHATDADHIIAVSTIVSRERSLGVASLIDVRRGGRQEKVHSHFHQHGDQIHRHPHGHRTDAVSGEAHNEPAHGHREDETALARLDRLAGRVRAYGVIRPVVVGVVHGLAGSAAIVLLVLTTIRTPLLAIGYLVIFGLGTILGMMLLTTAIAVPVVATGNSSFARNRTFRVVFALVSISFGIFLAIQNGVPLTQM